MNKEKAQEIVEMYKSVVYPYSGGGFMTGTESDEVILMNAKHCAKIDVQNTINALAYYDDMTEQYVKAQFGVDYTSVELQNMEQDFRYWDKVYKAIDEVV